jgi:hypothetical protein
MGGAMVTGSSFIIDICIKSGFPIMIIFTVMSFLSLLCSYNLPETFGNVPSDIIDELKIVENHKNP